MTTNHTSVPALLRRAADMMLGDCKYTLDELQSAAAALHTMADRLEKPTEAMLEAMLAAHRNPGAMGQTIEAWHQYKVGNAARMFIAAIEAAGEGL